MDELKKLIEKARKAYEEGKKILDKAHGEKRELTAEEKAAVDNAFDEAQGFKKEADELKARGDRQNELETFFKAPVTRLPSGQPAPAGAEVVEARSHELLVEYAHAVQERRERGAETEPEVKARQALHRKLLLAQFRGRTARLTADERKTLSELVDADGGYLATEELGNRVIVKLRDITKFRAMATVQRTQSASVAFPTEDYDPDMPAAKESAAVTVEDIKNWLGRTRFTPHARKRLFKIPRELMEDSEWDVESYLVNRFAVRLKELQENDFINGTGVEQPIGIATVTLNGEDGQTSGDVVHPLDVVNTVYGSSASCGFLMHRTRVKKIRSLRDESGGANTGQLLWGPPIAAGQPQTLHGFPLMETEFLAAPDATGKPHWIFGDFSYYWIVERIAFTAERLNELYKPNDQVGVLMRTRYDGAPVLKEAFYRLNRKA
jgi:HK97 family phage major capsid protein